MDGLIDLHTHSRHSDGVLPVPELVARAAARGVSRFALTDHDTVAGCVEAAGACAAHGIRFVPGVELSTQWRGQAIHVVGLGVDVASTALTTLLAEIATRRRTRVREVGERLERRGRLPGREIVAAVLESHTIPTRLHLARELVARGHARDHQNAFDRWLNRGRPGDAPAEWPELTDAVPQLARQCRAIALAHPHRYRLSGGALRQLVADFAGAGGSALEVSLAGMSPTDHDRVATLARQHSLAGSAGSDFHDPSIPWNPLGRFAKLAPGIQPVAERLFD